MSDGRPTSPSSAGGKPDRQSSVAFNPAAAAALAGASDESRPASGSTSSAAAPQRASVAGEAARPASPSSANGAAPGESAKTPEPARASVSAGTAVQEPPRAASGSVGNGDAKTAETRPPSASKSLGSVPEDAVPARQSVSKSSPAPAEAAPAAAPAAAAPAPAAASASAAAPTSSAVTASNGGGTAQTNKALADRADKKDQLAGGDKDISKPRPIEDVKRELEQGTQRCTDAWFGKNDSFSALKPDDGTVKYMGFVNDGGEKSALFFVEGGKQGTNAVNAKADEKAFRLLKLSSLPDTKEEVKLMYTSSPIVLAAAAGHGLLVKLLMDRFGLDPTAPQTVYSAVWNAETNKWIVDNSQGKKVSAGEVAAVNGFEDVAQTGGCRMCAGGDCVIA